MLTIKEYSSNPHFIALSFINKTCKFWPTIIFLKMKFRLTIGKTLNLKNPVSFNEKLQFLKLSDRCKDYHKYVDKIDVKDIIAPIIGANAIIKTIKTYQTFDEIDFSVLPNQFVIKCSHDSGGIVICKDKDNFDIKSARKKINSALKRNYFWKTREYPYKNIIPRVLIEEYMEDENGELRDYKLMCFNGKVKCSFVISNRFGEGGLCLDFYDKEWNLMPFTRHYPNSKDGIKRPSSYDRMVEMAELISKDFRFVRIDFYEIKGKPYFGEMTFYPGSGFEEFTPYEWDNILGSWLDLES